MVESSKIPTIGVGEGTTAVFRQMLAYFGFDEFEFLKATEATIKFGIRHKDWKAVGHSYDGPIDDPHLVVTAKGETPQSWLDVYSVAAGRPVQHTHLFAYLMATDKSPFARGANGRLVPAGPFHHAYHFDQALAGAYLRRKAKGVEIVDAQVSGARRDTATGNIAALTTDMGEIPGDFFIDCTGFRKALIGRELGVPWVSYRDRLPVNRALPFWIDHKDGAEIAPVTLAWARDAGWLWSIPTQTRYGCGYVYSDEFHTPETARAEIEAALGHKIEPRNDLKFEVGRLARSWEVNCLALGLSSSFLEPLEATSIHGTIVQMMVFTSFHLKRPDAMTADDRTAFNAFAARQVDDFRDFINLHYVTARRDTPFWRHVAEKCIGEPTRERLALWRRKMPEHADFTPLPGKFAHTEQQLHYPVLDGLGLLDRDVARAHMDWHPALKAKAREAAHSLAAEYQRAAPRTLGHREFLQAL